MSKQRTARALEDIRRRTFSRCHWMRYDHLSLKRLQETRDELLDHFAAHTLKDPTLAGDSARLVLRTAAPVGRCSGPVAMPVG
ncbi:hypothetical protein OG729_00675 [Streptomyces sp. NBC_00210]|uniref:hypothetical protein n=1 Tax=Streptomyces sp. NBC_00210 TaxID=2903636 RepID=UPI00325694F1